MVGYCCQCSKPTEHNIGAENRALGLEDGADSPESLWSPPYTPAITPVASRSTAAPETPPNMRKSRAPVASKSKSNKNKKLGRAANKLGRVSKKDSYLE